MTEVEVFRSQARAAHRVLRTNTAGITHEESLRQPQPDGNCMNWVVGHVQHVYEQLLPLLGQQPVLGVGRVQRYARGSDPLRDAADALEFEQLLGAWDEACARVDAGLAALTPKALAAAPPIAGFGDSVAELLTFVFFHQAYHAGQTGVLRRLAGREGAVK
jgi:uncharacterized damage-inducible protein DinB